jgi:TM2 domain-containing membrane protein YozV
MLLSTIFPGAGQFYTENYLKGAIITCAWGTLGYLSIREHLRAREALSQNNNYDYIEHRNQRNIFLWWTAAVWVFSIADAYVSSYMYKFKEQESLSLFSNAMNLGLKFTPQLSLCFEMKLREF